MYILPESVLQSFPPTCFNFSHLKKCSSDMELLNVPTVISSLADTSTPDDEKRVALTVSRVKTALSTSSIYQEITTGFMFNLNIMKDVIIIIILYIVTRSHPSRHTSIIIEYR